MALDGEAMNVMAVNGTRITVARGVRGTRAIAHDSGRAVYIGSPSSYLTYAPVSGASCSDTVTRVVLASGQIFNCTGSVWIETLTGKALASSTMASPTLTSPTLTTPTLNTPTINAAIVPDTKKATTEFVAVTGTTGTTLTNVVGMSTTVVPGTYRFYINVPGVTTTNAGIKYAFKYTTTVVGSLEAMTRAFTASAVAVTHSTTATDQALLLDSAAAVIDTIIEGTMVVTTGGTIQFQAAQKTAHADEAKVYVGASMTLTRIL
jgi:hypothetical protein